MVLFHVCALIVVAPTQELEYVNGTYERRLKERRAASIIPLKDEQWGKAVAKHDGRSEEACYEHACSTDISQP